jgi:hypothetical protein
MTLDPAIAIDHLNTPILGLKTAEDTLITYLQSLQLVTPPVTNLGEEDILLALQELQKAPTEYIVVVLKNLADKKPLTQDDVLVAVNLVQTYRQITSNLDSILTTLNEIDDSPSKISPTGQNLYFAVADARNDLIKALVIIQSEPGFAEGEVDIERLLQESKTIIKNLKPLVEDDFIDNGESKRFSQIVSQFVNHLERAQSIFKTLSSEDVQLTAVEIPDIQQLIQNWETITANLQTVTAIATSFEVQTSKAAIAQSIQIHNRLEALYDYLAEILRSNDLFNPAIL